jgi:imidazolonepropionase-like amidohydrolase
MRILILSTLFVSSLVFALAPTPAKKQEKEVVYHNATVHIGNGKVMKGATIAFSDGKISRLGYFKMKWMPTDIDLKGKHVYPGFILPVTRIGLTEVDAVKATIDDVEVGQLNPNVRSIVAYNTDSEIIPTLKFNGVLLAQPTPRGGLVSGLSSIVQLDAWNWQDAVIVTDDAVHVNWPSAMRPKFDMATFTLKTVKNKKYHKQIEQIKSLFVDAKLETSSAKNIKLAAVKPVFAGVRKVYIHANKPKAIIEAVNFFKEVGAQSIVLVTGQGVLPVIDFIKYAGIAVIVDNVHQLPKREDLSVDAGYTTAIKLHKAGVLTALAYQGGMTMGSRNLAFTAGTLVAYGLDKEQSLKMISGNTAKILGIDKNFGTLEVGKSATLFVSQGDALDMKSNIILDAYIDGRKLKLEGRQQELNQRYLDKYGK